MEQAPSPKRHSFRPLLFAGAGAGTGMPELPKPAPLPKGPDESQVRARVNASNPFAPTPPPPPSAHAIRIALPVPTIEWLDAEDVLDELAGDQMTMTASLARLDAATANMPRDPSVRAAADVLRARVRDLDALRVSLGSVACLTGERRFHGLFVPESPLTDYLRGLYAWAHAIIQALDTLSTSLHTLTPDWALVRWRIEEARHFHFDELMEPIRSELVRVRILEVPRADELLYAVEHLFATATALEAHLDERFG